ncbi:MAG: RsmF rRNA methyltransferase first C-terminal domain-containing protein [Lachnospiraceae bacterium]|nr:RsmF rRNA methyltransferase first C-terminal domain-containing protein [Lachnospiraceae bacterium]
MKDLFPKEYELRMKELLKDEYEDYLNSFISDSYKALRFNPLKADRAQLLALIDKYKDIFLLGGEVPWESLGFYYGGTPGKHPFHEAGAYYIQEPSAMLPVTMMEINKDMNILDLCAAPGGKTTQIAAYLKGEGLIICNEPVNSRAAILSENIERMGIRNAIVLSEKPDKLVGMFTDYFDRVLVDAPCSGEGMFRKNESAIKEWSIDNVYMCAKRQDDILESASKMLRPGGILIYSTCTFSKEEDEDCADRFLKAHPDYELISQQKLFPHRIKGEGHFCAKFKRQGNEMIGYSINDEAEGINVESVIEGRLGEKSYKHLNKDVKARLEMFKKFYKDVLREPHFKGKLIFFGDNLYLIPPGTPKLEGYKVMRPGLHLGIYKKDRFEPSQALAQTLKKSEVKVSVDISVEEAKAYISGLTILWEGKERDSSMSGFCLLCCEGLSLGWGKIVGNIIKNHYPKGLRKDLK